MWPTLVTGFGLGALLDGILLHQVLQWHHLVSEHTSASDITGLEQNTFWDGVFHAASWVVVVRGLAWLLARRAAIARHSGRELLGWALVGWGAFHLVDQLVFHMALEAHHIRMVEDYQLYDWGFAGIGVVLVIVGRALAVRPRRHGHR